MRLIKKALTYCIVLYGVLMAISCECNPETLICPKMNQDEVDWVYLLNQKLFLFTDSIGHKVTFECIMS